MYIVQYYGKSLPVKEYGGIERVIVWLIKGLRELGHKVTLISPEGSDLDCDIVTFPESVAVPNPSELKKYIPEDADIIHFHNDGQMEMKLDIPWITTMHGYGGKEDFDRSQQDNNYCYISDAHRHHYGMPKNPFVYNGLDASEYTFSGMKDDYFLFLSRIDWDVKGLDWAIKVAKRAGVRLIIAGNFHRKSFVNSYWRFPLKRNLGKDCYYAGPVGGRLKSALLAGARAMIFPTRWPEPFGIVAIEALASGTPVITTHNGAMPEIIEHGKNGFLCNTKDEMVEAVKGVSGLDPAECRKRVEEKFNYIAMAEAYLKLYQEYLKQ
ncbi:glycogen synthase [bacterium BMS3Bbin09]|nr:glycogen synthase [bacterium BMS3Bbin09]HDN95364.1 glycosyltransferase family 4 protein [Nitrospirota bacterium]